MKFNHIHFMGGGRITRILLQAFQNQSASFNKISVTDSNEEILNKLKSEFPVVITSTDNTFEIENADIVFIALHPPVIAETLTSLRDKISKKSIVVSLAPKLTIQKISDILGDHKMVVRMIPTALTITGNGYNPVFFMDGFDENLKHELLSLFEPFGYNFETEESKLEAYAIVTAMSPTYYWFQIFELIKVAEKIGLSRQEAIEGLVPTLKASLEIMENPNFNEEKILDLIPVKPLQEMEEFVKGQHQEKLIGLYNKIKP